MSDLSACVAELLSAFCLQECLMFCLFLRHLFKALYIIYGKEDIAVLSFPIFQHLYSSTFM